MDEGHNTITLTLEDDTEVECAILTIYPVNKKDYIALLPLDENGPEPERRGISLFLLPHRIRRPDAFPISKTTRSTTLRRRLSRPLWKTQKGRKKKDRLRNNSGVFFSSALFLCFTAPFFSVVLPSPPFRTGTGVIVHCDSVFYEDSLHKTCPPQEFPLFFPSRLSFVQFYKNMALVV